MKKQMVLIILCVFMLPFDLYAGEVALSLDEAVALALRDNRDIQLKAEEVNKAKLKIAEAEAGLFPTLNLTGNLNLTRELYAKDISQASAQATLKQYLYKGGKVINTIKYNGYNFEIVQNVLDKTKLEIVLSARKAFYTLILSEKLLVLNKDILDNTQDHLNFVKERYQKGEASESEVISVNASLSNVTKAYEESLNQVESVSELLKNILNLDTNTVVKPTGALEYQARDVAYDESFLKAMETRPEIKQYEAQNKANQKSIEIAKADNRPSIYASWDYYSRSHASTGTAKGWNDYNIIGLTFSWPIFDGWAAKAKVEQAMVDLRETQLAGEKVTADIALELKNAYLALKDALAKINATQSQVDLYKDSLSVGEEKYNSGLISSLALDDLSLAYQVALFGKEQASYDYIIAKASFDKATGGM